MKLCLFLELELGIIWTLLLLEAPAGDVGLGALMLFFFLYPFQGALMITGMVCLVRRPDARAWAAAVVVVPVVLLALPGLIRAAAGGTVSAPWAWSLLVALPLGACLLLPHQVAPFLPTWALRSRGLHVTTIVLLGLLMAGWVLLLLVALSGQLGDLGGRTVNSNFGPVDEDLGIWFLGALALAHLTALAAGVTFLVSYVGLFQRVDRSQQKLRIVQAIMSLVLLVCSVPGLMVGLVILMFGAANPG